VCVCVCVCVREAIKTGKKISQKNYRQQKNEMYQKPTQNQEGSFSSAHLCPPPRR